VGDAVATSRTAACVGALGDNLRAALTALQVG